MAKLKIEDLKKIREKVSKETSLRDGHVTVKITVPLGTCGIKAGARDVMTTLMEEIELSNRSDIKVITSGCMGMCSSEPNVKVELLNETPTVYQHIDKNKIRQIFKGHILKGEVQTEFVLANVILPKEI